jgi:rubrerythrin
MATGSEQAPTFASAAELMAAGEAMEREAAARYGQRAATMAAAGNAEVAALFRWLESEKRDHGDVIAHRAIELGLRLAPAAVAQQAGLVPAPDEMADEDPYTITAYRVFGIAVRNEQRAFAFYAYGAAHAPDREVRQLAEGLAHEQLGHAATLRRERRKAWRRTPNGTGRRRPSLPQSLGDLRALAARLEGAMAARHDALAEAAVALGDLASAEVLRSVAIEATGLLPGGSTRRWPPTPWCRRQPTPWNCCALLSSTSKTPTTCTFVQPRVGPGKTLRSTHSAGLRAPRGGVVSFVVD